MRPRTHALAALTAATLLGGLAWPGIAQGATAAANTGTVCSSAAPGDINGDGRGDLVVNEYGRSRLQGGIHVFYGTASGLTSEAAGTAPNDQFLTQDSPGVPDASETADEWGATLALGDFNADRCADVAIGAPGEDGTTGAVTVLYGSPAGLSTVGAVRLSQASPGVPGSAETNDRFGAALAVGDFDDDGKADLAVGVPGEQVGKAFGAGTVNVFYGATGGLGTGRNTTEMRPGKAPVGTNPEDGDAFGAALAAGDLAGTGVDALIVGVPGEDKRSGAIVLLPGGPNGLRPGPNFSRSTPGVPGARSAGNLFGAALAAGDFNGDGRADVAAGVPGTSKTKGAVIVLYAGPGGLSATGAQQWSQDSPGVAGDSATGDKFGTTLSAGRLSAGRHADLAIGVPGDAAGSVAKAGSVEVLLGTDAGLSATGSHLFTQDTAGVGGTATGGDRFGAALTIRQIDGSGPANLVIGSPAEGTTGTLTQRSGAFEVLGTSKDGPTGAGSQFWALQRAGVEGDPGPGVFLGYALG